MQPTAFITRQYPTTMHKTVYQHTHENSGIANFLLDVALSM